MWNSTGHGLEFTVMTSVVDLNQAINVAVKEGVAPELHNYLKMELNRSLRSLKDDVQWLEDSLERNGLLEQSK